MTVDELKRLLAKVPNDAEVLIGGPNTCALGGWYVGQAIYMINLEEDKGSVMLQYSGYKDE